MYSVHGMPAGLPHRGHCLRLARARKGPGALAAGVTGTWEFLLPPRAATVSPPFSASLCVVDAFYHALKKDSDSGRSEIQAPEQKT